MFVSGCFDLAGDIQCRDRVQILPQDTSDSVRAAGPRCDIGNAQLPAGAIVTLGSYCRSLFMVVANVREPGCMADRIVKMHGPSPGYEEAVLDTMSFYQVLEDKI